MSEKYDFSKIEDQEKFEQLPQNERDAVVGEALEEGAEVKEKAQEFAEEGERPTARDYRTASEQIGGAGKREEIILTPQQQAAQKEFIKHLLNGDINYVNYAINIKNEFSLPEEIVQQAAQEGLIRCLLNGYSDAAIRIKNEFSLPEEFVRQVAKKEFIKRLLNGDTNAAINIKDEFSFSVTPQEIIDQIPELQNLLNQIQNISPEFYQQALKSVDIVISLSQFKDNPERFLRKIQENPFLLDAVSENPRFGSKLLIKFPEFDELSKENITFLFAAKKEILANNPDIDPESLEFRQLMQEKLKGYENNAQILKAIEKSGINANEWLNYAETRYFNLESGDSHLAFSEIISTPINRIKETLDGYAHALKNVLKEYKPELSEFKIPLEDAKETEEKIVKMQAELEKAKTEGNKKKAQGIEKGMEGLKKKIENIKTVALWDKLLGDIAAFQQLKNDVFGAQEKLTRAEDDMREKLSGKTPSGKIIQELKEKINSAKEELRSKFGTLEQRIENFQANLPELLSPCLKDRTDIPLQIIRTTLAEQFDHYNTDRSTLANLFSERGDKEKEKLENQPMSIFVWARNPDIDLYQGNYSDCCIKINSDHTGAKSTIADYNTDLGIQIVNIWDEVKNEPITAAWCWLGKDEEGSAVLVVDNIESNTLFSANYSEQLTKELFDYLKDYAQSIGAKKIVLGKAYNDLPIPSEQAKMMNDDGRTSDYEKIGGYNRSGGYYNDFYRTDIASLVWKAEAEQADAKSAVSEKEKKIQKIEFAGINLKNLAENDFSKIKQLERKIYAGTDLISGQAMIEDIKSRNGLEYSIVLTGKRPDKKSEEIVAYIAAVEGETDEGDACIYLEDIAVLPEAQGQGIGWNLLKGFIDKLKEKAKRENKPVLLDMHLRENSQRFMERHRVDLEQMGVKLLEEALVADYYDEGEDALYQAYEVKAD